jgi:hypothetical protein
VAVRLATSIWANSLYLRVLPEEKRNRAYNRVRGVSILEPIVDGASFRRRSAEFLRQLKKSKRPVVLTVRGKGCGYCAGRRSVPAALGYSRSSWCRGRYPAGRGGCERGQHAAGENVFRQVRNPAWHTSLISRRDLALLFLDVDAEHSDTALTWYRGLKEAILSLEEHPGRCPVTPENKKLRHLLYGHKPHIYRVIYRVIEKSRRVDVLHIRHGVRGFGARRLNEQASGVAPSPQRNGPHPARVPRD